MATNKTEIVLKKEGEPDITITCPVSVKVPFGRMLGFHPRTITPFDKHGAKISAVLLGLILVFFILTVFSETGDIGILMLIPLVAYMVYTRGYYVNFIRKHIRLGYEPATEEQVTILKNAGVIPLPTGNSFAFSFKANLKRVFSIAGVAAVVLVVLAVFNMEDPIDRTLDKTEKIVQKCERFVEQYERGGMSEREATRKIMETLEEIQSLENDDFEIEDLSPEQQKRFFRLAKKIDELTMRTTLRSYY